eukprot:scaffold487138_cov35-Prasinocladus_malaysianus.AAC.1
MRPFGIMASVWSELTRGSFWIQIVGTSSSETWGLCLPPMSQPAPGCAAVPQPLRPPGFRLSTGQRMF